MTGNRRILEGGDPDVIEVRSGGGLFVLLGAFLFVAGFFALQVPLDPTSTRSGEDLIIFSIVFPMGIAFTLLGAYLALARQGLTLNRRDQVATRWWGLLFPMKKSVLPLGGAEKVLLRYHPGDDRSPGRYSISLVLPSSDAGYLEIMCFSDYREARRTGECVSRFIGRPLDDCFSESQTFRESGADTKSGG